MSGRPRGNGRPIRQFRETRVGDISIRGNQGAFFFAGNIDAAGPGGMFANVAQCSQARFFDADAPDRQFARGAQKYQGLY